ncbi:methionine synthase [Texcoconibacillus texcoconensis]|uniref:Methionine synthase n=1 Tax=Texcoconibacillus texcoconensis TaxID=1095777 RepID=A0A840QM77_9BACI|nr:methionine synthase [Texcoconibacillus texcoconensis]MBB5172474.1 5-methyltetrahydrofolate--homocysteine methyltransferase [Texcoconibacillus texcoconensis]
MGQSAFEQALERRILILDGGMGTMLQNADLSPEHFGGEALEGCNEKLNEVSPDVIREIYHDYLAAGADIIETNTFGATSLVLEDYNLQDEAYELNRLAAVVAKEEAEKFSSRDRQRFVAGAMGPTTKSLSVTGGTTFEALAEAYAEQVEGLIDGGVDVLLLETSQDMRNVKAAYVAIEEVTTKRGIHMPLIVSGTIEPMGTTLAGQSIEAFYISLEHMNPTVVGLNCATGPEFMQDHLRSLSELSTTYVHCYPNAGLPDEEGHYHETPQSLAKKLENFAEKGWLNIVGGCCGTTPEHIRAIREVIQDYPPRRVDGGHPHAVSGIEPLVYDESMRPLLVGERTNVIGSRKFKRLIAEDKFEEASEIARAQVKKGAQVIDVCLADPDRDEMEDMEKFLSYVVNKVKAPLMLDSTDEHVLARALTYSQGKAIINSINLEDGEERFEAIAPLVRRYGAAIVVGTIDEQGMGVSADRKVEIARRSYDLLVNKYGIAPQDIIFDPLVFPVGTGDEQYIGSAEATVEGIRRIKEEMPECMTILGVSNVSFGLPPLGREVLNAAYMYHCTRAGLDYAIVNTEKLERYGSIPDEEKELADKLLFDTNDDTLAAFTAFYREKKPEAKVESSSLPLEERLALYIVEGTKDGLYEDLDEALEAYDDPLSIINGPLMNGMDKVGKLFNDNELIVAEVLQSAEAMKAAVAHLEPHMEAKEDGDDRGKGKILLATVKGDVHDIGKNLVDIILSNNGFQVVNLGIKVTSNELIEAVEREKPDAIGLSGLLVKSTQQMVLTANDLRERAIDVPMLVGGAALTRKFTETKITKQYNGLVLYAKDAMNGLEIANQLADPKKREVLADNVQEKLEKRARTEAEAAAGGGAGNNEAATATATKEKVRTSVSQDVPVYQPEDFEKHVLRNYNLTHLQPYVNMQSLIGSHLGVRGNIQRALDRGDERARRLLEQVNDMITRGEKEGFLRADGLYQFFPAQSDGDDIIVYDPEAPGEKVLERFSFPRQSEAPFMCLADFLRPVESGEMDSVGFLSVTAGKGVRELAEAAKERGDFLESHMIQAVALELAEAFAERVHQLMRDKWGIPDSADLTMQDRFSARYQGIRVSFGYPACPDLEDQEKLFRLLEPRDIGVGLTDEYMMEPEASVTAMVFAHPEGRYFSV